MQSTATSAEAYLAELPEERQAPMKRLRQTLRDNLPEGFEETMAYGMIGYVVPHSLYPAGYHCDPKQPLPFISLASQKNYIALYHMGLYSDPNLLEWFKAEYAKQVPTRLDMGKSCIRFKKPENIPYELIAKLARKISPQEWIATCEKEIRR